MLDEFEHGLELLLEDKLELLGDDSEELASLFVLDQVRLDHLVNALCELARVDQRQHVEVATEHQKNSLEGFSDEHVFFVLEKLLQSCVQLFEQGTYFLDGFLAAAVDVEVQKGQKSLLDSLDRLCDPCNDSFELELLNYIIDKLFPHEANIYNRNNH